MLYKSQGRCHLRGSIYQWLSYTEDQIRVFFAGIIVPIATPILGLLVSAWRTAFHSRIRFCIPRRVSGFYLEAGAGHDRNSCADSGLTKSRTEQKNGGDG